MNELRVGCGQLGHNQFWDYFRLGGSLGTRKEFGLTLMARVVPQAQRAPRETRQGKYQDELRVGWFVRELTERMNENANEEYTDSPAEHAREPERLPFAQTFVSAIERQDANPIRNAESPSD